MLPIGLEPMSFHLEVKRKPFRTHLAKKLLTHLWLLVFFI